MCACVHTYKCVCVCVNSLSPPQTYSDSREDDSVREISNSTDQPSRETLCPLLLCPGGVAVRHIESAGGMGGEILSRVQLKLQVGCKQHSY